MRRVHFGVSLSSLPMPVSTLIAPSGPLRTSRTQEVHIQQRFLRDNFLPGKGEPAEHLTA